MFAPRHSIFFTTLTLLAVLMSPFSLNASDEGTILLEEHFEKDSMGGVGKHLLSNQYIEFAEGGGKDGSDAIRVTYIGYEQGSKRVVETWPLKKSVKAASISFDVRFDEDFQWVLGGKLHGLGPKKRVSGGNDRRPDGWSARIMFKEDGKCLTYLYDQDLSKKWGRGDNSEMPVFTAGQWHHVTLQVRLNDAGKSNGSARILIDGEEVVFTDNIEFRGEDGDHTLIQTFLFSTFHGGNKPTYTPRDAEGNPTTLYANFDNFIVVEDPS